MWTSLYGLDPTSSLLLKISPFFVLHHPSLPMSFLDHSYHHINIIETYRTSPTLKKTKHFLDVTFPSAPFHSIFAPLYSKTPQKGVEWLSAHLHILFSSPHNCHPLSRLLLSSTNLKLTAGVHVAKSTDPKFKLLDFFAGFVSWPLPFSWVVSSLGFHLLHFPFPSWPQTVLAPFSSLTYTASFDDLSHFQGFK